MRAPQSRHRQAFAWQAILIILPLCLLAAFGMRFLQQDRLLARHAAVERAQAIADSLSPQIWEQIAHLASHSETILTVDSEGNLLSPVLSAPPDELVKETARLVPNQGLSLFKSSLRLQMEGKLREAAEGFATVAADFPNARGETGLPLGGLAAFKLLELRPELSIRPDINVGNLESFCSNIVMRPSPLTPHFLLRVGQIARTPAEHALVRRWQRTWELHERAREIFEEAKSHGTLMFENPEFLRIGPPLSPNNSDETSAQARPLTGPMKITDAIDKLSRIVQSWEAEAVGVSYLFRLRKDSTNASFAVLTAAEIGPVVDPVMRRQTVPPHFKLGLELGGSPFRYLELNTQSRKRHGTVYKGRKILSPPIEDKSEVLASSTKVSEGVNVLRVRVLLTDGAALYQQQRVRSYWLGALILLSSGAALLGIAGAWRSFKKQEQLNLMKSNFVSSVSHELRAPIASVRLMAENLERGKILEESRRMQYFRFISQECRRLSSLIENVLDFSRIEQGRKQYEFEVCDLAKIVDSTVELLQPAAQEQGLRIVHAAKADAFSTSLPFTGDGKALRQALINLVDNAIKHSPKGSVITIGFEAMPEESGVRVWVEDHGEGIPASEHEKIFERFYRLGSELRRETQGIGIGLSIVKHVVDAHRGRTRVRSAPGQGSRFTIELPGSLEET